MLKIRNIIITILVSSFVIGIMSYVSEFNSINDKMSNIDYTLQTALDMSIQQCIMSDDFYLEGFNYGSTSGVLSDNSEVTNTGLWVYGANEDRNLLDAIMKYDSDGYDAMRYSRSTDEIKSNVANGGDIFKKNAFDWQYNTQEFLNFYTWVRDTGKFKTRVFYFDNNEIKDGYVCTLDLMGLSEYGSFESPRLYSNNILGDSSRTGAVLDSTDKNSDVTKVLKEGYYGNYMITPTALGITYINKDMLIPVLKSNIEMMCAYAFVTDDTTNSRLENDHRGCTDISYYGLQHTVGSNEYIVNNGVFEVDLNSINVDIEYKAVDMFNSANNRILDVALGAKPLGKSEGEEYYDGDRARFLKQQYNLDEDSKYILVAKIDISMIIHIPFGSPLLQQYRGMTGGSSNHLDIRAMKGNKYDKSMQSGVLYTYTTYTAVTP